MQDYSKTNKTSINMKLSEFLGEAEKKADPELKPIIAQLATNVAGVKGVKVGITKTGLLRVTTPKDEGRPVIVPMARSVAVVDNGEEELTEDEIEEVKREVRLSRFLSKYSRMCVYAGPPDVEYTSYKNIDPPSKEVIAKLADALGVEWQRLRNYVHLYDLDILAGDDLVKVYNGIQSCMSGHNGLTRFYGKQPSSIRLAVARDKKNGGEVVCRALLWQLNDGGMYMDRIYPTNNGTHMQFLRHMAQENGWQSGSIQNHIVSVITLEKGQKGIDCRRMPFFDTMRSCKGTIKNGKVVELQMTSAGVGAEGFPRSDGWVTASNNNPFQL